MYPHGSASPVDAGGIPLDRSCSACGWTQGEGKSCLPADGRPGGLLVVGDAPVASAQRPFASRAGSYIRELVVRSWDGPVVYDYAVKCPAKGGPRAKLKDAIKPIRECRPYLASVLAAASPTRVLSLGSWAAVSLLGRSLDMESVRRGVGWVRGGTVPTFILDGPLRALENKFLKTRYEEDVRWALTCEQPRPSHLSGVVQVVDNADDALFAEDILGDHDELLFDVETAGVPHGSDFTILCAGLSPVDPLDGDAWVWSASALTDPAALGALRRMLATKKIAGSNVKYDMIAALTELGVDVANVSFDTQIVRKLLDPMAKGRLEYTAELVGRGGTKEEAGDFRKKAIAALRRKKPRPEDPDREHWCSKAIIAGGEPHRYSFGLLPEEMLLRYNGRDCATSADVVLYLRDRAEKDQPGELACWDHIFRPAMRSFTRIESTGLRADRQAFDAFSAWLNVGLDVLRQKFKAYGANFNPNAPKQVADVLFNKLGFPKGEVSEKTGDPSTDKDVLEGLRGRHPFVDDMIEWRRLEKMDGTYGRGMIEHILDDGRIHPTFRLDGTETLRISSENPNGQNIPRAETAEGRMARDGFTASPGRVLVELDQSQIELRVAAGMSGDPEMIAIFTSGLDYHLRTAQLVSQLAWRIAPELVTDWHRSYCKTVNFGLLYGKTDAGLAAQLGCTIDEAAALRAAILGRFKKLAALIKRLLHHVRTHGSIDIPWVVDGVVHTRPLYEVGGHDKWKRNNAENSSINSPIQGRAALYTIASIPRIHAWIDEQGFADQVDIVNTVHDSIMLDCEEALVDLVVENGKRIMTDFDCWGVPLEADAKAGPRWGSLRKIKRGEKLADAEVRWAAEALKASSV